MEAIAEQNALFLECLFSWLTRLKREAVLCRCPCPALCGVDMLSVDNKVWIIKLFQKTGICLVKRFA